MKFDWRAISGPVINVKFRNGKGLRFSCTVVPDGRCMLS